MLTIHIARDGHTWYGRKLYRIELTNDRSANTFRTRRMTRTQAFAFAAHTALHAAVRYGERAPYRLTGKYTGEDI